MKRFINPADQFFKNDGSILTDGTVTFWENYSSTVKKDTYNGPNGSLNLNPLPLDGYGRIPPCFGSGLYSVEVKDSLGVRVWYRDDVDFSGDDSNFSDWSANNNYSYNNIVRDTIDGLYYQSQINDNLGNQPSTNLNKWTNVGLIEYWNSQKIGGYANDAIVIYSGSFYRSLVASNTTTPGSGSWLNMSATTSAVTTVYKPSNTARASTAVLAADPHLSINLTNGKKYYLKAFIPWQGDVGNGIQVKLVGTNAVADGFFINANTNTVAANAAPTSNNDAANPFVKDTNHVADKPIITIDAYIDTFGATPKIEIHWCQKTSSINATTVYAGAMMQVTQLN